MISFPKSLLVVFSTVGIVLLLGSFKPQVAPRATLAKNAWVDSVFETMTLEQKIGQLFMVAAYSNRDEKHYKAIDSLVQNYHLGGLIFMQGGPVRQAKLTNRYQALAKIPLFISIDGEWGLAMRLDSTVSFPRQMALGAVKDVSKIYDMGHEIALQCKRMGIHINFAPVVDVNSNPANPVIGFRSFGENKEEVVSRGIAYMKGLQDQNVLACAKHFPGHGDTDADSHFDLPVISHSKRRMEEIELYPFKKLIKDSIASIMVAHIHVPVYDDEPNKPTTLSEYVITDLLKGRLDFEGLVFTDALNMKGIAKNFKPGEIEIKAFQAGNDVLLFPENVPLAVAKFKDALEAKDISSKELDKRVKKILHAKYWAGLNQYKPIALPNLYQDINSPKAQALRRTLYSEAATVVKNDKNFIPIEVLDTLKVASISLGNKGENFFQQSLSKYIACDHFQLADYGALSKKYDSILAKTEKYNTIVVGLHQMGHSRSKNYNLTANTLDFLNQLAQKRRVILCVFGNAYALKNFENFKHVVCFYEDNDATQSIAGQVIFGGISTEGQLPISASSYYKYKKGEPTPSINRLRYSLPYMVGMNDYYLQKIDSIANKAIADGAMPGCQILIAKDGHVVYQKNFGYLTYDKSEPVTSETLYDVASVTKVAATLQAIMFLQERGKIVLDTPISVYIPQLIGSNKEKLLVRDILVHQAGLQPFLEHWRRTISLDRLLDTYYCDRPDEWFSTQVAPNLFGACFMLDSIWKWTIVSKLIAKEGDTLCYPYKYSDIGFYLMKQAAENQLRQSLPEFLNQNIYTPLGMSKTGYLPLANYNPKKIAPTEWDKTFRGSMVRGTVHDQGAAMMGGVAGHAGLFSTANDLAILMQMNLQRGVYGGARYLQDGTILTFKKRQYMNNRRGLGWDKPEFAGGGGASVYASSRTFGHTGFTGTCVWVDPKYNLVYVFLSNRTYPNADNKKLINMNIRTKIHDMAYLSILNFAPEGCVP